MTLIEISFFFALQCSVAFCFVFQLRGAFPLAALIGVASTSISFVFLLVLSCLFHLTGGRMPSAHAGKLLGAVINVLAPIGALALTWHNPLSYFGFIAFTAASAIAFGAERWTKVGFLCLAGSVVVAIALHVCIRLSTNLA